MKQKSDQLFQLFRTIPLLAYEKFHAATNQKPARPRRKKLPATLLKKLRKVEYKEYAGAATYRLPHQDIGASLQGSLAKRASHREFSGKPLSLREIGTLLHFSAGKRNGSWRFYPSAGARYPLELYVISLNTELPKGLYHYNLRGGFLEQLCTFSDFSPRRYLRQDWSVRTGCLIVITAVFERTVFKYGDRGYRYCLIESGHLAQNLSLLSTALGLESCVIGGFADAGLSTFLGIDGVTEAPLYVFAAGNQK